MPRVNIVAESADVLAEIENKSKYFRFCKFKDESQVRRFIVSWGRYIEATQRSMRPRGILLVLNPETNNNFPMPNPRQFQPLISRARHSPRSIDEITCGLKLVKRLNLSQSTIVVSSGGQWSPDNVAMLSASGKNKNKCFFWANNLEAKVFIAGVPVLSYSDVITGDEASVYDLSRKQGWRDGELLKLCAIEKLGLGGDMGIWKLPAHHILFSNPEKRIQHILHEFLLNNLSGLREIQPEAWFPSGRIDFYLFMADGRRFFVEIKWIGVSLKKDHKDRDAAEIKHQIKIGQDSFFYEVDESAVVKGIRQIKKYIAENNPNESWLVAYDCRKTPETKEHAHDGEETLHVFQVAVSPGVASRQ